MVSHMTRKHGFTLVELLVVIAIIGVLVGLLLPAVQAAREASRRTQCMNHLRQIGLALQQYESTFQRLPSGWISPDRSGEPGWGWSVALLPFIEQNNILNQIDQNLPIEEDKHEAVRLHVIPIFLCPSDVGGTLFMIGEGSGHGHHLRSFSTGIDHGTPLFKISKSNYSAVFGTREIEADPYVSDGMFHGNSRVRFRDVSDGLSNTLMVGERSTRMGGTIWHGVIPEAAEAEARIVGTTDHPPNHPAGHFEDFGSYHVIGAHFVMGDGSTRIINNNIDESTYRALATKAGAEPIRETD